MVSYNRKSKKVKNVMRFLSNFRDFGNITFRAWFVFYPSLYICALSSRNHKIYATHCIINNKINCVPCIVCKYIYFLHLVF